MGSFAVAPAAKSYLSGAVNFFFVGPKNFQVPKKLFDPFHSAFLLHCGEFFCFQESES
jgi:hypothetical protein